ncbi:RagB/SusD family nutrient uptake outer membrane protein [Rapidithrix thailandica]|uniref:RagB/SusD family nutrient uptake outer membrane protein n=1 Tax=Rapidithrix thailandica TaxID=413964 RepID=A0AAW9S5J9_9BACT
MRKYIYHLVYLSLFATTHWSCNYLDVVPDNVATIDNAFTDKYNAEKFLFTCYSYLPQHAVINVNPALLGGDETWASTINSSLSGIDLALGLQNVNSPIMNYWNGERGGKNLYTGIRDCNIFLEEVGKVPDLREYERKRWVAEVKFLKAYFHFWLIKNYGPIHLVKENIPVSASTEEILMSREPVDSCFNYVSQLLDEAIPDLPLAIQQQATELGRITQPVAYAIKARVLMTAASPLFNGNTDFAGLKDQEGNSLFSAGFEAGKWEKAAKACREAIEICEQAGHGLYQMNDYVNPFEISDETRRIAILRNCVTERWNKELIWGNTVSMASGIQWWAQPRLYSMEANPVTSRYAATLRMAETFYSKNGVPIEEDKNWEYEKRFEIQTATEKDRLYIKEGETTAKLHYDREPRFYASLAFDRGIWYGNGRLEEGNAWHIEARKGEFASTFNANDHSITGYWPKKLVHINNEIQNGVSYEVERYPWPVVRLADLYLYYAEALNEVKGAPDAEVYAWVDRVRERAGLEGVKESWTAYSNKPNKPVSKEGMREIIQQERMIELAFEGARYWDLRRWKLSYEYLNKPVRAWRIDQKDPENYYRVQVIANPSFEIKDYLFPIKEYEMVINPNLVQNPGW